MSRLELDRIQSELKAAVQSHQLLVARLKAEPEHSDLQQTLHNLQSEIRSLSEQQKSTVHQLKCEILTLQTHSNSATPAGPPVTPVSYSSSNTALQEATDNNVDVEMKDEPVSLTVSMDSEESAKENENSTVNCVDPQKLEFMASLKLATPQLLSELRSKRSDQKRRHNVYYQFSYGHFEPETELHEDCCCLCRRSGDMLMCDVCSLVYHLECLEPPLTSIPTGLWSCPKCQSLGKLCGGKDDWPGTLALVHSYLTHKAGREEEKLKLRRLNEELSSERHCLELRARQLADTLAQRLQRRNDLTDVCSRSQQLMHNINAFITLFRQTPSH